MNIRIYMALPLLLAMFKLQAQDGNHGGFANPIPDNSITASPDAMAFQKIHALPVSLYTGKIDLTIPIYEIRSGNITVPISISYNSGGIKVDDIASSVGIGWNINAGGNIVRNIRDLHDNEIGFSLNAESDPDLGTILTGWIASQGYNRNPGCANYREIVTAWGPTNKHAVYYEDVDALVNNTPGGNPPGFGLHATDLSPDLFMVSAPGLNSKFTCINTSNLCIYPDNNTGFTTTFLDGNGARMDSVLVDIRTIDGLGFYAPGNTGNHKGRMTEPIKDFFEFQISNNSGLVYDFDQVEVSEGFYSPLETQPSGSINQWTNTWDTMDANNYTKRIHTWNLSKITDPATGRSVDFQYGDYANDDIVENTMVNDHTIATNGPASLSPGNSCYFAHNTFSIGRSAPYAYLGAFENWEKHPMRKRLQTITFDGGTIDFIHGLDRLDYLGEKALTEVQVKDVFGNVIKKVQFSYTYFDSKENCSDAECKRLRLDGVSVFEGDDQQIYTFDYEYTDKLPKRGSLQQDYLGYYNNNGVTGNSNSTTSITPQLYFYPNQGQHSILPFQRANENNYQLIPGAIDFTPNSYSLTGLLTRVTYPTGGTSEFEYENNSFRFMGEDYVAGGARVRKQTLKDKGVTVKQYEYTYLGTDGNTSGEINNIPVFGYPNQVQLSPFLLYEAAVYDKPKGGIELTSGSFVGYSRVLEIEPGNGHTEYLYSSSSEHPNVQESRLPTNGHQIFSVQNSFQCSDELIDNSAYPSLAYVDNDYKRGKLKTRKVYSESDDILRQEEYILTPRTLSTLALQKNVKIGATELGSGLDAWDQQSHMLDVSTEIPVAQHLLTTKTTTEFLGSGQLVTIEQTTYKPSLPIVDEVTLVDSNGDSFKTSYTHVLDKSPSESTVIQTLHDQNRLSALLEMQQSKNGTVLKKESLMYGTYGNLVLPMELKNIKGNSSENIQLNYLAYDDQGNILEFERPDGNKTVYIWGYNDRYPIAKIEGNISYDQVNNGLTQSVGYGISTIQDRSDEDNDNCSDPTCKEEILRNHLDSIRTNFPEAMVTTFTYDPLIGITSTTDARGYSTYYLYDGQNRLKEVRDEKNNLVTDHVYNLGGQQ
ncbi:hypothetical protein [Flagellimonas sp.]|uniref:hypothetical protein n=1 Tax=Flagellimonas sp. TaxID=2058762 RepID=UPI003BB20E78